VWEQGRAMSLEEALAYGLSESPQASPSDANR